MCYVLYVASALTLSEVRSMLPAGMTADGLAPDDDRRLRRAFRPARTVARLAIGPCACDFILQRDPVARTEEAALRKRYAEARLPRSAVIRALQVHRGGEPSDAPESPAYWQRALGEFVAEHARNAGPTHYWLHFAADPCAAPPDPPAGRTLTVAQVMAAPDRWLTEDVPVRIVR